MCGSVLALPEGSEEDKDKPQSVHSVSRSKFLPGTFQCHSLDGDSRLSEVLPPQLPGGGETNSQLQTSTGAASPGLGYEWSVFRIPAVVLPALLDGRKKHNGVEKEELKTSKRKEETKGREKGEKLRERKEASSSKQTTVSA
jgi:hypothetical protein